MLKDVSKHLRLNPNVEESLAQRLRVAHNTNYYCNLRRPLINASGDVQTADVPRRERASMSVTGVTPYALDVRNFIR